MDVELKYKILLARAQIQSYDLQRFAAEDEGRTELPTERRKREERQRGNVPRSQEIASTAVLFGAIVALFLTGIYMFSTSQKIFQSYLEWDFGSTRELSNIEAIRLLILDMGIETAKIVGPLLLSVLLMAIIGNVSQFGLLFSMYPLGMRWEKIRPDFRRILPGKRTFFNLSRILLQVILISGAAYVVIVYDYTAMLKAANMGLSQAILLFAKVAFKLLVVATFVLALISIPDFLYQRHEYLEKLKTTLSEAKRERKDDEGDPLIRQRQRERSHELRKQRNMLQDVSTADVIITNPKHVAVGLKYEPQSSQAPILVAKGSEHLAFIIRNIAREHKIPIEENPPLARALYEEMDIGQEIPETLYKVVSLIFSKLERFQEADKVEAAKANA